MRLTFAREGRTRRASRWWTRRDLLRAGAGIGVATGVVGIAPGVLRSALAAPPVGPTPGATSDGVPDAQTIALLEELIRQRALSSQEPWLLAHVVLALGPDVKDGKRLLLDAMVSKSLELTSVEGKAYPSFSLAIERHPFHFLQILQLVEVPYDRSFSTPSGTYTRREIIAGSEATFDPTRFEDESSWVVCVLTHEIPPERGRFRTATGRDISVASIVDEHLRDTEAAYAATFASMDGGKPYGRGALHTKACNGLHLVYGLIDALRNGYRGEDLPGRFAQLVRATIFRLQLEQKLVDATLRAPDPLTRLNADAVKLSFLGHAIENFGYGRSCGVVALDATQLSALAAARRQLGKVVERITTEHDLDRLQSEVPKAYDVLLGDACHALRGLRYWA